MARFIESEHPRDKEGKFTDKNKTSSSAIDLIEPLDEKSYYEGIKMEYENSTDQDLLDFIYQQLESPNPKARFTISEVNKKQIEDIKNLLGIDVTGFKNVIDHNAIMHIKNRHGLNGKADKSMSNPKDLARIGYILENYDSIEILKKNNVSVYSSLYRNKLNKPVPIIKYQKRINGYFITSQAIIDSKNKRLSIETAYRKNK